MALIMYFFKRASPTADADMIGLGEEEIGVLGGWVFFRRYEPVSLVGWVQVPSLYGIWFLLDDRDGTEI